MSTSPPTSDPAPLDPDTAGGPSALAAGLGQARAGWFAAEVQPHEAALRSYLRGKFPKMNDVDDVVHDSYLALFRQPAGKIVSTRAYLFAVARSIAIKVFRKQSLYADVPVNELPEWRLLDEGKGVTELANRHQQDSLIAEAIATLPDRCREIFKLRLGGGLSHAEIAARLGLSEPTVRVQVARGLAKCVRFLRERGVSAER